MLSNQERFDYLTNLYQEINTTIDTVIESQNPLADKMLFDFEAVANELIDLSKCDDVVVQRIKD